jgi:hypothetical protein
MKHDVPPKATLRRELVLCGKAKCKRLHGPYWYAYWQQGARTRKVYVGKELPSELRARRLTPKHRQRGSAHDRLVVEELVIDDER